MNRVSIPREVEKWLQTLDLSYKIANPKRDLCNGFLVAEIFSRYGNSVQSDSRYTFDMRSFSTGQSMKERQTNWSYLRVIFFKNHIPLNEALIDRVMNQAPNAAFELLLGLYKYLTKRDVILSRKVDETDQFKKYLPDIPKYMRPIATTILRNNEIQRIKDNITRQNLIHEILAKHKDYLNAEREVFIKSKRFNYAKAKRRKLEAKKEEKSRINEESHVEDEHNTDNFAVTKNDIKKEEKANVLIQFAELGRNLNDYNVEHELVEIIKVNFIDTDHNIELELKKVSGEDDIIKFFFDKINLCNEDHFLRIISAYEERQNRLTDIISKTLSEMITLLKFFTRFFDILVKNSVPVDSFKNSTYAVCLGVLAKEKGKCENIFLNFGLDVVLKAIADCPVYRSEMCKIIFSLVTNSSHSHFEVLQHVRRKFANSDEAMYYHVLVQCMTYLNEDNIDAAIFEFYEHAICKGIVSNCDVVKTKAIYMVTLSMVLDQMNALTHAKRIFSHVESWNWEILSLLLIYASRILLYLNSSLENKERFGEYIAELSKEKENNSEVNANSNSNSTLNYVQEYAEVEERIKEIQKLEGKCLETIDAIFHLKSPNNTLKIGFIYLADILHYYPKLSEKYMRMMIELNYVLIRSQVLDVENADLEFEYTGNSLAEKYKISGAPLRWLPIYVAGVFRDYILGNEVEVLDITHLEILHSIILNRDFNDEDADLWIDFYSDIKPYIFVSLSNSEFSDIALSIAEKLFTFDKIRTNILESTFETFISTMRYVYDSGDLDHENNINMAPKNMKILLTFISEIKSEDCQSYIYKLIKTFAIGNNEIYLKSNLLDLMNNISQLQRGEIFDY